MPSAVRFSQRHILGFFQASKVSPPGIRIVGNEARVRAHRRSGNPGHRQLSGHTDGIMRAVIQIPLHRHAVCGLDGRTEPAVVQGFAPVAEDNLRRSGKGCAGGRSRHIDLVHDLRVTTCVRTAQTLSRSYFPSPTVTHDNGRMFRSLCSN